MKYRNRNTGQIFLHLAHAVNLDDIGTSSVIVFCPHDSENSIFTMMADKFSREYEVLCHSCVGVEPDEGESLELCTTCAMDKILENGSRAA